MIELIKTLLPYIKPYWKKALAAFCFSFVLAGIKFSQAYLVKPIFDRGLSSESTFEDMLQLTGLLLFLGILNFPARYFHFYWIRYVVDKATCAIRLEVYQKLQHLPLKVFTSNKQGTLVANMMTDTQLLGQGFRSSIDVLREPLSAFAMIGLALYRDWQLTMVIVAVAPLFIVIFGVSGKKVKHHQADVQESLGQMTHCVSEGISGQKIAKAFNLQSYISQRFNKSQIDFFKAQMKTARVEELAHPLVEFVGAIGFSGVILFAHHRISSGAMSTGDFLSFGVALALMMDPIRKYSSANVRLNQARAAGDRVFELMRTPEEIDEGTIEKKSFDDSIEFKNVSFGYGHGDVIQNLNFKVKKGQRVALVGLSGSGKSTIINLLLRLYPLEKGQILIDGIEIEKISLASLRELFGLVSQDIFLFNDSIRENLKVGKEESDGKIQKALEIAGAKDFVAKLPEQIETVIGDRGAKLSGGQAQRVTIGRAFLQDSPIFLFDEATSALDNESEKAVQAALDRLSGNKTIIAVAHRLSTIQNYDQIIVLRDGLKIEEGEHQNLLSKKGEYSKLYELSTRV